MTSMQNGVQQLNDVHVGVQEPATLVGSRRLEVNQWLSAQRRSRSLWAVLRYHAKQMLSLNSCLFEPGPQGTHKIQCVTHMRFHMEFL